MDKDALAFLEKLVTTPSPSGYEQPGQKLMRERMGQFADSVRTDVHGNVIAALNPAAPLRVMLAGHVDEIGLMVNHITNEGYIYVTQIGGIDPVVAIAQRVTIHGAKGPVAGVIGRKAIHLTDPDDRGKPVKLHELWIDIGAKNKKDAQKAVSMGDPITFDAGLTHLRNHLVTARAFDDRMGAFVVAETLRKLQGKKLHVAVYGVSTVQEEIGLRGARTSAFGIDPQAGIAIDVGHATDTPGVDKNRAGDFACNKGPIVCRGANINPVLYEMIVDAAKKAKIAIQIEGTPGGTGTDANAIQINRAGVAAGLVSVPCRYMHSPCEVISLKDLDQTSDLLAALLARMPAEVDFTP
ncbi:MAG TPA: M42 family metallopeptidase [Planctomycetota bacterium]|nr:M42 family metallopeptidase [Planctomycetota bacterium]HRR80857.1 M42 family metallopeptidase [Planctomycetota bacterium]HRT97163.1 M42 family metallopeptidase [Planctomycetota bacterium]